MRDLGVWLKSFAIGLEMMAKGIHSIAKTMYDMANSEKPESTLRADTTELNTERPATNKSRKMVGEISKTQEPEEPAKAKPPSKKAMTSGVFGNTLVDITLVQEFGRDYLEIILRDNTSLFNTSL